VNDVTQIDYLLRLLATLLQAFIAASSNNLFLYSKTVYRSNDFYHPIINHIVISEDPYEDLQC
jgi:hypothetical protein